MQNFPKIAKFRCREICEPQNREINMSRKFHVIRYSNLLVVLISRSANEYNGREALLQRLTLG